MSHETISLGGIQARERSIAPSLEEILIDRINASSHSTHRDHKRTFCLDELYEMLRSIQSPHRPTKAFAFMSTSKDSKNAQALKSVFTQSFFGAYNLKSENNRRASHNKAKLTKCSVFYCQLTQNVGCWYTTRNV